jgi:hypothetical protein
VEPLALAQGHVDVGGAEGLLGVSDLVFEAELLHDERRLGPPAYLLAMLGPYPASHAAQLT